MDVRKILGMVFMLVVAVAAMQSVAAIVEYGYLAEVTKTSFIPATIRQGDSISLSVDIKNRGVSTLIEDLNATLDIGEHFEAIDLQENVEVINAGTTKTVVFRFKAKDDTVPGFYSTVLKMKYLKNGEVSEQTYNITVPVSKTEKNIDVTITPTSINPGNQTEITFTLRNLGGTAISNIAFSWSEASDLVLPLGSDNKKYISEIRAGEEADVTYNVAADPNISPGIYPLNITIIFNDTNGTRTQESDVGFLIGGKTDFDVSAEVESGQVSLSIANIGSNNAAGVIVKVPQQAGVTVTGSNTSIIGNLNKGDFTLANFQIGFSNQQIPQQAVQGERQGTDANMQRRFIAAGPASLTVQIDYTDTTGARQTINKQVQINTTTSSLGAVTGEMQTITAQGTFTGAQGGFVVRRAQQENNWIVPLMVFAVVAAGTVFINTRQKEKKAWKSLAKAIVPAAVMFLATIFFLNSDLAATAISAAISIAIVVWFYGVNGIKSVFSAGR